jgi:proline iminopeptidase
MKGTTMKRKIALVSFGTTILLVALVAGVFRYISSQPLYKPGMVRCEKNLNAPLIPPAQPSNSNTWLVQPGVVLAHFAVGKGRNVLIVHGGPGSPYVQPMSGLAPLTNDFRFHYYDQRGCGESTRPVDRFESSNMYKNMLTLDRSLGLGAQIADIERIRRIMGDEKLILIGHSWGGFLASLYAAEFPEHVEALLLISPANTLVIPQTDAGSDLFGSVRAVLPLKEQVEFDEFMKKYFDFKQLFKKSDAELVALNEQFGKYYMRVVKTPIATLPKQGKPGGWMVWGMYVSMGQHHDYRSALQKVGAPVVIIHGSKDLQSEASSRLYEKAFRNSEFAVIKNAGHFAFEEQPEQFAKIAQNFLERINKPRQKLVKS